MEKNNIHNQDIFGESIKSKLENYSMPLDESVWKGIEKQLAPKKNRVVPFWFWLSSGIAASFLIVFLLNPFQNTKNDFAHQKTPVSKNNVISTVALNHPIEPTLTQTPQKGKNEKCVKKTTTKINPRSAQLQHHTLLSTSQNNNIDNINNASTVETKLKADDKSTQENRTFQAKEANSGLANSDLQVNDSIPAERNKPELASLPEIPELLELPPVKQNKKRANKWLLAANIGTSGNTNFDFANESLTANLPQLSPSEAYGDGLESYANAAKAYIMEPNDFDDVEYLNPVSIGFSVQKELTSTLSLSSGLVYTYLRANYSLDNQWQQADASLDLHYLGIPLNLNVMIAEKKHWNYYFSFGGMLEKGLRSVYKQDIRNNPSNLHETNVYSNIEGVQTSANAAFGIGYKLHKHWSLFFEPKFTYYFKNNQPMSARTETPLNVGLNGGLKLGF